MMTFLDLKNAFGSVSHRLIVDMLHAVKVPQFLSRYIQSFYSILTVVISTKTWETQLANPFHFVKGFIKEILCPQ